MDNKMEKMLVEAASMARRGTPEEIAKVYAFLTSNAVYKKIQVFLGY